MKKPRITIETTSAKKKALDAVLRDGLSLQELFDSAIEEATGEPLGPRYDGDTHLKSLAELGDAEGVLARLQAIDWSFTDEDTSYLSHDIHPYPAKFIPQIPRHLITNLSLRGEAI